MKLPSKCRLCHKSIRPVATACGGVNAYAAHITTTHPEVRKWLARERIAVEEKLEFARRTVWGICGDKD